MNAGVAWEPMHGLSLDVDYWKINKRDVIGTLDPAVVFADFERYAQTNIVRGPVDPRFPALPGPIETVLLNEQNLGDLRTSGVDVGAHWSTAIPRIGALAFGFDGSYVVRWDEQLDGIHDTSTLGRKVAAINGPVPRWKHHASLDWERPPFGATLGETFQSGYVDANVDRAGAPLVGGSAARGRLRHLGRRGSLLGIVPRDDRARHQESARSRSRPSRISPSRDRSATTRHTPILRDALTTSGCRTHSSNRRVLVGSRLDFIGRRANSSERDLREGDVSTKLHPAEGPRRLRNGDLEGGPEVEDSQGDSHAQGNMAARIVGALRERRASHRTSCRHRRRLRCEYRPAACVLQPAHTAYCGRRQRDLLRLLRWGGTGRTTSSPTTDRFDVRSAAMAKAATARRATTGRNGSSR